MKKLKELFNKFNESKYEPYVSLLIGVPIILGTDDAVSTFPMLHTFFVGSWMLLATVLYLKTITVEPASYIKAD